MSIHVALEHRTVYHFDRYVTVAPHVVRLRPAPHSRTPILAYSMKVEPGDHYTNWMQDPFGNFEARLVFPEKTDHLSITVDLIADLTNINPFDFFVEERAEQFPFDYGAELLDELTPYLKPPALTPKLFAWVDEFNREREKDVHIVDFLVEVNQRLQGDIGYSTRMEPGVQSPEETLTLKIGSCRDTGWLLVQILRHFKLAARFVSGYLVQLRPDEAPLEGPVGPAADFTDLHAWCEVFVPGAGWIGLDPTSGLFAGEGHIPLAATPEPSSAAPVTGAIDPCEVTLEYSNTVTRIFEDPRVTYPYTDAQWERIDELGHAIDDQLTEQDVRLTVGGEPTFISIDKMEAPEWTIAADGEHKRELASELVERLTARFAPGAALHHGQGKWYPGEPLPRWQTSILWRADGQPLWRDPGLLADPAEPGTLTAPAAEPFLRAVARVLGAPEDCILPAYEDPLVRLVAEAMLPDGEPPEVEVDPTDPTLADADQRAKVIAELDAATGDPAGWVLPLHHTGTGWGTSRWQLRRGRLFLAGGDSPLGLRLPLGSLGWTPPVPLLERSTFDEHEELAPAPALEDLPPGEVLEAPEEQAAVVPVDEAPPSAIAAQVRDGHLHVFLPPLTHLEHAVELLNVLETIASRQGLPLVLEGYTPPRDPRLRELVVAPDPGVIEVNVQPTSTWDELSVVVTGVYTEARQVRLGTDKFDLDGRHTGTGGGNHLTLGGANPADSPLLRRPDLLRSLITFWQHHPSLSYLFSGSFIGPTSQAPRVDEARTETLYELEIAFAEMDRYDGDPPPWLVDRLLRHLLVDLTGNTHRSEFCIDKLFAPGAERGRLGLVELRGFEMPPHPRMSLVQHLLVRSLVARFWDEPYTGRLVRWGTDLYDRFMLPWYVAADIAEVVADLDQHGIAFEEGWLAPFLEFRFPRHGQVQVGDTSIELRSAIEPWNVLGEEIASGGTARYVDSSVERLQVRVDGYNEARHMVTCNGIPVPLTPTGSPGTAVAGVRYRAWAPPSALHPTIGVHSPLVFDLIDRWSERSLGGCTYHVVHPGGRGYDRFPANALEAEARRVSRFEARGHSPGPYDPTALATIDPAPGRDYGRTLDLRRFLPGDFIPIR